MSGDVFDCHNLGSATGIWLADATDITNPCAMHRVACTAKNCLASNDSSAKFNHDLICKEQLNSSPGMYAKNQVSRILRNGKKGMFRNEVL